MLDYSILLTEDKSGKPKNGTSFHLTHTKLRDLHPELPQTCRFVFTSENNILNFQYENTETALNDKEEKVLKMRAEGKDGKTIANELGVDPSTISRTLKRAQKKQITDEPPSDAEA
jgi:DNA-binding CsgD family transcriptional regulator